MIREVNEIISETNKYDFLNKNNSLKSWISKYKLLDVNDKNIVCPITMDKIDIMDKYCKCSNCNYNFNYDYITKHLDIKYDCPMCRCEWINLEIYINSEKKIKNDLHMFDKLSNKNTKNKNKIILK